jgi:hypothetical protein
LWNEHRLGPTTEGRNDVQADAAHIGLPVAMSSRPEAWLAVAPAHLPHYSHTAVTVGTVILLAIIVMVTMAALAVALSQGGR